MISKRGETYVKAGLADGYLRAKKKLFDKDTKEGIVSFGNAENVRFLFEYYYKDRYAVERD